MKEIINKKLCTRCGTCTGVCPTNALNIDEEGYPIRDPDKCIDCNLCMEICPGLSIDMPGFTEKIFGENYKIENRLGVFKDAYVTSSTNSRIQKLGTSGGFVTEFLIHLLENKEIDGAIIVTTDKEYPERATAILAQNKKEILNGAQSRYTIVPVNRIFKEIKKKAGKFALVGLPCHIHGFRKLSIVDPKIADKIVLVIGLYCGFTMESEATADLIKYFGVSSKDIQKIEYRGGDWPGEFRVILKDGTIYSLNKDIYRYFFRLYCPGRCLYCIDYSNELADISVADAWIANKEGGWEYPDGKSIILIRTKEGKYFFDLIKKSESFFFKKIPPKVVFKSHRGSIRSRKIGAIQRLINSKSNLIPDYNLDLSEYEKNQVIGSYSKLNRFLFRLTFWIGKSKLMKSVFGKLAFNVIRQKTRGNTDKIGTLYIDKIKSKWWKFLGLCMSKIFRWESN